MTIVPDLRRCDDCGQGPMTVLVSTGYARYCRRCVFGVEGKKARKRRIPKYSRTPDGRAGQERGKAVSTHAQAALTGEKAMPGKGQNPGPISTEVKL